MTSRGGPGSPSDEMFLNRPNTDSPTIEPLRIQKREGMSPPPGTAPGSSQQGYAPPKSYSPPPGGPLPGGPLPGGPLPGGPSPGGPLPYPDDRPQRTERTDSGRLPYPDDDHSSASSPPYGSKTSGSSSIPQYPRPQPQPPQAQAASKIAERRGTAPKPLPDSPGPDTPDKEGLFQKAPKRPEADTSKPAPYDFNKVYYPPPVASTSAAASSSSNTLHAPNPVNRFGSTASNATTRAQRGSPPPPETPVGEDQPGGGIEARYAASGIPGTGTMTGLQAQSAAAAQRANQYAAMPPRQQTTSPPHQDPPRRPWTPTELPGSTPHVPVVYQGSGQQSPPQARPGAITVSSPSSTSGRTTSAIEEDIQRMQVSGSPPPAYSSVGRPQGGQTTAQGYPNEKASSSQSTATPAAAAAVATGAAVGAAAAAATAATTATTTTASTSQASEGHSHPAYANDPRQQTTTASQQPGQQNDSLGINHQAGQNASPTPSGHGPASPPPLPEGWIAHLDPKSGHYYYIHLQTQSTQWEFPKGPTPLNLNEPTSPVGSHFGGLQSPGLSTFGKPLASPGFAPTTPGYAESVMSFQSQTPTVAGFTGPPPVSGVDIYKIQPTNAVYFGPYLRYANMNVERGTWHGSILLITDNAQPPTIHIHQSTDLSPNPRQLKAAPISRHQRWAFYRYDVELPMEEMGSVKWTYAITSHLGCTRYEFLVAGKNETNWRFIATSGNDFDLNVSANERSRLGGVGYMWKDIMAKHSECGGFHAQLGMGSQIYADRIWREIPALKQWLAISGKENRKNEQWTARHEEDVTHAFFHYYTSHFDQPFVREAFAQIPHILQIDDHDIFDGFGSYPEYMQFSSMFKNIGRIGIDTYLLFQHHTTLERLRNVSDDFDIFTITGTGWHFIKYLGPAVVVVGPDCRSERNPHQVMAGPTYQGIFPKVATLPQTVQHCIWMISVPVIYPRLETAESIAHTVATGKKAITGTYNLLGKVAGGVAGVIGAKEAVGSGFNSIKKAVGKSGLMGSILSPFGEVEMLDEMRDAWTHESKDLERTYLIRTLQGIAQQKSLRMTFLSGGTNCCGAGLVHDPSRPQDHKTMYQIISSSVVNAPASSYIMRMLHHNKPLYIPPNGHRSTPNQPSDTKEDMMEIFPNEPDGRPREYKRLMARRNYVAIVAYDPEVVSGTYGRTDMGHGGGRLSLAADFMCQADGGHIPVAKYGPVIIPSLEFGR